MSQATTTQHASEAERRAERIAAIGPRQSSASGSRRRSDRVVGTGPSPSRITSSTTSFSTVTMHSIRVPPRVSINCLGVCPCDCSRRRPAILPRHAVTSCNFCVSRHRYGFGGLGFLQNGNRNLAQQGENQKTDGKNSGSNTDLDHRRHVLVELT